MADTLIVLQGFDDDLQREVEHEFEGRLLAESTSQHSEHSTLIHAPGEFAPQRTRCSACRWLEVRIYANEDSGWVVQTVGRSIVPGEEDRHRVHFCSTPRQTIAALTHTRGDNVFLPNVAKRALDLAADLDHRLEVAVDEALDA
jgi:hypothetical protein